MPEAFYAPHQLAELREDTPPSMPRTNDYWRNIYLFASPMRPPMNTRDTVLSEDLAP